MKKGSPLYIVISLLAGIVGAAVTFAALIFFFFSAGLFGWADGGDREFLERLERNTNTTLIISIIAAISIGGFIIYKMNKPNNSNNHSSPPDNT